MNNWGILFILMLSLPASGQGIRLGTLHVVIQGLKSQQGRLRIALEKSAAEFDKGPLHEAHYRGETLALSGSQVTVSFRDVPFGSYAVKTFHDADGNGVLNTNLLGVPTEDYGFSNNTRRILGPALFKDAQFTLEAPDMTIYILVK